MELSGNTVLVTGGASGIGLGLAEQFVQVGSTVIICGRREDKLKEAQAKYPQLQIYVCDVADSNERVALFEWVTSEFPALNVLINNAGIQQRFQLQQAPEWETIHNEIAINLDAPIHLATLFIPHFMQQAQAAILNVTSGLAFSPMAMMPIYGATKAAMHSFTLSLRHQLSGTPITVVEVIPPAVDTDLGGVGLHTNATPLPEYIASVIEQLKAGSLETTHGFSANSSRASREQLDELFKRMNQPR
ncbi:MAG: SDR family NAD(P)-dependent oxidoreductase [Anaerolineae bacterium]|nr:SDR family NAD(P)-dependent oxidoreductase [Anaerolineae bacterium]